MSQSMQLLTSHVTEEWYTPPDIIGSIKYVLGNIDLDPASAALPQTWIKANRFWTKEDDALSKTWRAETVFLNPPYGKEYGQSSQAVWSRRISMEYSIMNFKAGIALINSTHGYRWYEELWIKYPVCCLRERLKFIKSDGTVGGQAKRGQTLVLFSDQELCRNRFREAFGSMGRILLPDG